MRRAWIGAMVVSILCATAARGAKDPVDIVGVPLEGIIYQSVSVKGHGKDSVSVPLSLTFAADTWYALDDHGYELAGTWAPAGSKVLCTVSGKGVEALRAIIEQWLESLAGTDLGVTVPGTVTMTGKPKAKDGAVSALSLKAKAPFTVTEGSTPSSGTFKARILLTADR